MKNQMVVVLNQDRPKHAEVLELLRNVDLTKELRYNIVEKKQVKVDDLICSFLSIMEARDVLRHVFHDKGLTNEYLEPFISNADLKELHNIFLVLLDRFVELDPETASLLLNALVEKVNIAEIEEEAVNTLFRNILNNVSDFEKPDTLISLYRTLISNSRVFDAQGLFDGDTLKQFLRSVKLEKSFTNQVLESFLNSIKRLEHQETIKEMFTTLAELAERDWMREVMAPYLEKQKVVRSPVLPKNCILYLEELDGTKVVVIEVPKGRHHVTYQSTPINNVGFPKLLFAFYVHSLEIRRLEIMAVKDKVIKPTTRIYHYPFSNVYENFTPCWGDIPKKINHLSQLATLPYQFITAPNNDHLYRGVNLRETFMSLQDRDFDDSLLTSANKTIKGHFEIE